MSWQWQNDRLWQSCSDGARRQANSWKKDHHFMQLHALVDQQPLVTIAEDSAMLTQICEHAQALRSVAERLVVVGTGGASLGAATLCALANDPSKVRFLENCDPVTLAAFLRIERETTAWVIISKSGETAETLATTLALMDHYRGQEKLLAKRVRVITANPESSLGRLARAQQWVRLEHPPQLGGRFSAFSIVGLFPAAFAGMDVEAMAQAAHHQFHTLLQTGDETLWQHAVWLAANAQEKPMQLMMGYADRLRAATQWYKQLWAESLGKQGRGPTPVTAIGAIDQHSQLQLYLDGPRDKLVTLVLPEVTQLGKPLPDVHIAELHYLAGRRMGEVMHATAEATVTTMAQAGVPMRVARGELTPVTLSEWMARQMLETLLVASLLDVNPYDQPAVEAGKKLARQALLARGNA